MAISRAETLTTVTKKTEYFSDFSINLDKSPFGNDLAKISNEKSVNQSLRNLVKTNLGERLFQPTVGTDVYASLFELDTESGGGPHTDILIFNIKNMIKYNEPRINLIDVTADVGDGQDNTISITIVYSLINNPDPTTLTMLLKRVR
jgi:hypothetical protein